MQNPTAFAFSSSNKAKEQRCLNVPIIDRTYCEPSPYVVIVQGPPQETFEFLNILQVHGFPKVMGVLTHLDKQRLKHRFWTEIYDGAKLFFSYQALIKENRFEHITPPEKLHANNECDRKVTLYGYLRGCNMKKGNKYTGCQLISGKVMSK